MENYAFFENLNDEQTGIMAVGLLKDKADTWYRTTEKPPAGEPPLGWLTLKRLLKEFFCPENSELLARDHMALLTQTGDISTYINNFMDLKLAITDMTDVEACDKFMRGLREGNTVAYVRQYYDGTLKTAIKAALTYDSAHHFNHQQSMFSSPFPGVASHSFQQPQAVYHNDGPTPMDLDWIDRRQGGGNYRGGNNNGGYRGNNNNRGGKNNSSGGGSSGRCYFCGKTGHIKRNCRERLNEIKRMDETRGRKYGAINLIDQCTQESSDSNNSDKNNKDLIDFDACYSSDSLSDDKFPLLKPQHAQTSSQLIDGAISAVELNPIIYPTTLYYGSLPHKGVEILIDSGASENYVSPGSLKSDQELIPVTDRKVETAGGQIAEINKFDLILGRAWLKQEKPTPDWSDDSWYLSKGSIKLKPHIP